MFIRLVSPMNYPVFFEPSLPILIEMVFIWTRPGDLKAGTGLGFEAALDKLAFIEIFGGEAFLGTGVGAYLIFFMITFDFGEKSVDLLKDSVLSRDLLREPSLDSFSFWFLAIF
jgi:hypothetical protein